MGISTSDILGKQGADTLSDITSFGAAGSTGGKKGRAFEREKALKAPQTDAARDLIRRNIIIARIRRAAFAGAGRAATIATSPRGLTGVTTTTKRTLQGT